MHLAWVRDACHKNPLLFISADTGVRKILIGWAVKSNLLTCISKKQPWCRHRRKCLYSSGISFGRSKLLHLCGNFTFKPELEPNIIARLAGKEASFSFLFRAFLPLPLPFWSLSRRLNIPFISLVLLKARERGRVLRARKERARVLSIARASFSRALYFLSACHTGYQPRKTRQTWLSNDQQVDARSLLKKVLKNIFTSEGCLLHALFNYAIPRECLTDNRDFLYLQSFVELQLLWSLRQKGNVQ